MTSRTVSDHQSLANAIVSVALEMDVWHMPFTYVMLKDDVIVYPTGNRSLQEQMLWHDQQSSMTWSSLFSKYVSSVLENYFKTNPRPLARSGVMSPAGRPDRLCFDLHGICERFDPGLTFYVTYDRPYVFEPIGVRVELKTDT